MHWLLSRSLSILSATRRLILKMRLWVRPWLLCQHLERCEHGHAALGWTWLHVWCLVTNMSRGHRRIGSIPLPSITNSRGHTEGPSIFIRKSLGILCNLPKSYPMSMSIRRLPIFSSPGSHWNVNGILPSRSKKGQFWFRELWWLAAVLTIPSFNRRQSLPRYFLLFCLTSL